MAKSSITGLTDKSCRSHIENSVYRNELACPKIIGFHLQKLKSSGCWRYRYSDFNGKKRLINLGKFTGDTANRLEAAEKAIMYGNMVREGIDPVQEKQSRIQAHQLAESRKSNSLVSTYLNGIYTQHQNRKAGQGKTTIDMIKRHFKMLLDRPMESISVGDLKQWQAMKEQDGLSHSSIKRIFGAFRTMLRHAVREHIINQDPSINFQLNPPTASEKDRSSRGDELKTRRMLTPHELNAINNGIALYKAQLIQQRENSRTHGKPHLPSLSNLSQPHWFFPLFYLAAYTGLRIGDLYSLNWQELNIQFKRLVKVPNKTKHHNDPIKVDLPLNDNITQIMADWHTQNGNPVSGLVFPSPITGKQLDRNAHLTHWKQVLTLSGINSPLDFYALRHHYISAMVSGGVALFTVARLAGHKSVKMIEQHYGHLAPHAAADALALVANGFNHKNLNKDKAV